MCISELQYTELKQAAPRVHDSAIIHLEISYQSSKNKLKYSQKGFKSL